MEKETLNFKEDPQFMDWLSIDYPGYAKNEPWVNYVGSVVYEAYLAGVEKGKQNKYRCL